VKKKIALFVIALLSMVVLLSGCSTAATTEATGTQGANSAVTSQQPSAAGSGAGGTENPSPGQGRPDLFGKVKSIAGNEVTLLLADMPEMPERAEMQENTAVSEESKETARSQAGPGGFAGGPPGMERGENQPVTRDLSAIDFTGETKTLLIPVATPVVSGNRGEATEELDFSDIEAGDILQIWLDDEERVVYVRLQKAES